MWYACENGIRYSEMSVTLAHRGFFFSYLIQSYPLVFRRSTYQIYRWLRHLNSFRAHIWWLSDANDATNLRCITLEVFPSVWYLQLQLQPDILKLGNVNDREKGRWNPKWKENMHKQHHTNDNKLLYMYINISNCTRIFVDA